jgi:hypothetical protein
MVRRQLFEPIKPMLRDQGYRLLLWLTFDQRQLGDARALAARLGLPVSTARSCPAQGFTVKVKHG